MDAKREGISIGLQQGIQQANISSAKKLLKMGLSLEQIAAAVNLPLDEVQKLSKTSDDVTN